MKSACQIHNFHDSLVGVVDAVLVVVAMCTHDITDCQDLCIYSQEYIACPTVYARHDGEPYYCLALPD